MNFNASESWPEPDCIAIFKIPTIGKKKKKSWHLFLQVLVWANLRVWWTWVSCNVPHQTQWPHRTGADQCSDLDWNDSSYNQRHWSENWRLGVMCAVWTKFTRVSNARRWTPTISHDVTFQVKGKVVPGLNWVSTTQWRRIEEGMYRPTFS
jgi:hypothetical protein